MYIVPDDYVFQTGEYMYTVHSSLHPTWDNMYIVPDNYVPFTGEYEYTVHSTIHPTWDKMYIVPGDYVLRTGVQLQGDGCRRSQASGSQS